MILSYDDLRLNWKRKKIRFNPDITEDQITESSIDLRLGKSATRLVENKGITIRPAISTPKGIFENFEITNSLIIKPQELILILTHEAITMPANLAADIEGRSSYARYGLGIHITSPHIHPLFNGPVTLEIYNYGPNKLEINPGDRICQLIVSTLSRPISSQLAKKIGRYIDQTDPAPQPLEGR